MPIKDSDASMLTPRQLARRWGVAVDKVLALIHTGELRGINLAVNPNGRPRWRIYLAEVERFEKSRAARPAV